MEKGNTGEGNKVSNEKNRVTENAKEKNEQ